MSMCGCECHGTQKTVRQVLMDEHRVIERVLGSVQRMLESEAVDVTFMRKALDFFRSFADGCHHAKEENELFPRMEQAGVPRAGGPIGCMLEDHTHGRELLRTVAENLESAESGDAAADARVRRAAAQYIVMLSQHIQKEDNVLFIMAEQVLSPEEKQRMLDAFTNSEKSGCDRGKHAHYLRLADELENWTFTTPAVHH